MTSPTLWVVYRMALTGGPAGRNAVCTQAEWDAIEFGRPGRHTLIRSGIGSEGEAERLARGLQEPPGEAPTGGRPRAPRAEPPSAAPRAEPAPSPPEPPPPWWGRSAGGGDGVGR